MGRRAVDRHDRLRLFDAPEATLPGSMVTRLQRSIPLRYAIASPRWSPDCPSTPGPPVNAATNLRLSQSAAACGRLH